MRCPDTPEARGWSLLQPRKSSGWPANTTNSLRTSENKRAQALEAHEIASGRHPYAANRRGRLGSGRKFHRGCGLGLYLRSLLGQHLNHPWALHLLMHPPPMHTLSANGPPTRYNTSEKSWSLLSHVSPHVASFSNSRQHQHAACGTSFSVWCTTLM